MEKGWSQGVSSKYDGVASHSTLVLAHRNISKENELWLNGLSSSFPDKVCIFSFFLAQFFIDLTKALASGSPIELIDTQVKSLSDEDRAAFLELSYVDSESDIPRENILLSIFQTNGISAGESEVGIFPKTARLNHACSAGFNSVYTWREKDKILGLFCDLIQSVNGFDRFLVTCSCSRLKRDSNWRS